MSSFLEALPLSLGTRQALVSMLRPVRLRKAEVLFDVGDPVRVGAFVEKGLMQELYVTPTGLERTRNFVRPGEWTGAHADFLAHRNSRTRVEALAPSELLVFPMKPVMHLAEKHDDLSRFLRTLAEQLYVKKSEREFELLTMNAQGRYECFLKAFPGLECAQHRIASYLGVTPIHLSRLRRRSGS
jgi:CRP-like cAMP-binding protein